MDKDEANNAIKSAWIAGIIVGVIILVVSLIPNTLFGLEGLIEVFIYFSLSFGVYKKSRACAVIFFIYFVSFKIFQLIALADWKPGLLALVISFFLFQGIRGTFAYHRIIKAETNGGKTESESTKKKSKKKLFLIGFGVAAAIVVAIVVGFIIWAWNIPAGGVKMANEMHPYALEYIEEHDLLNDTEALIAYYDVTGQMDGSEAAILTTERVMYHKDGRTVSIDLKDIDDVSVDDDILVSHIIKVRSKSEVRIKIVIASGNQGELFYNALMDAWNLQKTR
ncbi:MAG: PH domain-containing protein [Dehalococcoidales bacterium]